MTKVKIPKQPEIISYEIGARNQLTTANAKRSAEIWLTITTRSPHAVFVPSISGYDDDPRELWEFEEVRSYMRQWAKFAGITSPEDIKVKIYPGFLCLFALCECEGFEHIKITNYWDGDPIKKTTPQ
jgi:hypothetical protein